MENLVDWLALYLTPGLGAAGCKTLVDFFGSPARALDAGPEQIAGLKGIRKKSHTAIAPEPARKRAVRELEKADRAGVKIICWDDNCYPEPLRNIYNPPVLLYVKGDVECLNSPGLAVVGSRAASTYGLKIAEEFSNRLSHRGLTILSGLALGIDGAAHKGALAGSGRTIAVLGCGVDVVYPRFHKDIYEAIACQGALVSEYPLGIEPEGFRFPARNRIISGLALGVLVVEAAGRSGSLITARLALEQGRDVFAIPGRIDSLKSKGSHRLLQEGAKLVHCLEDIIDELPPFMGKKYSDSVIGHSPDSQVIDELSTDEQKVLACLDEYPKPVDDIILATGLSASKVNEALLLMELKGACRRLPGNLYQK